MFSYDVANAWVSIVSVDVTYPANAHKYHSSLACYRMSYLLFMYMAASLSIISLSLSPLYSYHLNDKFFRSVCFIYQLRETMPVIRYHEMQHRLFV